MYVHIYIYIYYITYIYIHIATVGSRPPLLALAGGLEWWGGVGVAFGPDSLVS